MSKQTDDLIDRVEGAAVALRGVKVKLSPQPTLVAGEISAVAGPAPQVTPEDFAFAKKVIEDMKGALEALEAEVSRESKVPEPSAEGKAKSTAKY